MLAKDLINRLSKLPDYATVVVSYDDGTGPSSGCYDIDEVDFNSDDDEIQLLCQYSK